MKRSWWERNKTMQQHISGDVDGSLYILDTTNGMGRTIITNLSAQNETIRRSNSRLYEVGGALGLSQTTMRTIERHVRRDRLIVANAVVVIILLFILFLFYF